MIGIKDTTARRVLRAALLVATAILALVATGCSNDSYDNKPKTPAVLTVSVFIGEDRMAYSPRNFGAGPVQFVLVNQTGAEQHVTISTDRYERSFPLARQQTIKQKMTVEPGFLSIEADNTAAEPLEIEVGPERESAQQDLNQP
ncbi:MAG: hypothetical protein HZB14_06890 [Actinobacteria bacterium]|nr:hypothetical protein [Actinomycetota bacterium]